VTRVTFAVASQSYTRAVIFASLRRNFLPGDERL
jgi:hypothetical protein